MRHLLRTWIVEVHSWNHIAIRRLVPAKLISWLNWLNKPLFTALRLIAFPLTYFQYAKERAALTEAIRLAHSPLGLHVGLSGAHLIAQGAPSFADAIEPGGNLLLAGLLETQEKRVRRAYTACGFRLSRRLVKGDWSILWLRKSPVR